MSKIIVRIVGLMAILAGAGCGSGTNGPVQQPGNAAPDPAAPPGAPATFSQIRQNIIQPQCIRCHSGPSAAKGIDYSTHAGVVRATIPGNPDESPLYQEVASGAMPPNGPALPLAQIRQIRDWIAAGAPNN